MRTQSWDLVQVEFIENLALGASVAGAARTIFVHHELGWVRCERVAMIAR